MSMDPSVLAPAAVGLIVPWLLQVGSKAIEKGEAGTAPGAEPAPEHGIKPGAGVDSP